MSDQPTPETDAEHAQFAMGGFTLDFCRKLERERDEAREDATNYYARIGELEKERDEARKDAVRLSERLTALELSTTSELAKLERERDEARELNAKLFALADRATDDLRWFYESHADGISSELEKLKEAAK